MCTYVRVSSMFAGLSVSVFLCTCVCVLSVTTRLCVPLCLSRDLMAWLNSMAALMSSDELAKDVSSAEALLEAQQVQHTSVCGIG